MGLRALLLLPILTTWLLVEGHATEGESAIMCEPCLIVLSFASQTYFSGRARPEKFVWLARLHRGPEEHMVTVRIWRIKLAI